MEEVPNMEETRMERVTTERNNSNEKDELLNPSSESGSESYDSQDESKEGGWFSNYRHKPDEDRDMCKCCCCHC